MNTSVEGAVRMGSCVHRHLVLVYMMMAYISTLVAASRRKLNPLPGVRLVMSTFVTIVVVTDSVVMEVIESFIVIVMAKPPRSSLGNGILGSSKRFPLLGQRLIKAKRTLGLEERLQLFLGCSIFTHIHVFHSIKGRS